MDRKLERIERSLEEGHKKNVRMCATGGWKRLRRRMYVGAGTNWSPVTGVVFGEFVVSDVATPCIRYLILYCMVKITVQWQHIKTCKHYSVLSLLPPFSLADVENTPGEVYKVCV